MYIKMLDSIKLRKLLELLPRTVLETLKRFPGLALAGGSIGDVLRGEMPRDYDLWWSGPRLTPKTTREIQESLATPETTITAVGNLLRFMSPTIKVDLVRHHPFGDTTGLVQGFDFTVCQAALFYDTHKATFVCTCSDRFYPDNCNRVLVLNPDRNRASDGNLIFRLVKYLGKGFHILEDQVVGTTEAVVAWGREFPPNKVAKNIPQQKNKYEKIVMHPERPSEDF